MTLEEMEIVEDIFHHKPLGTHTYERKKEEKARRERIFKAFEGLADKIKLPTVDEVEAMVMSQQGVL